MDSIKKVFKTGGSWVVSLSPYDLEHMNVTNDPYVLISQTKKGKLTIQKADKARLRLDPPK